MEAHIKGPCSGYPFGDSCQTSYSLHLHVQTEQRKLIIEVILSLLSMGKEPVAYKFLRMQREWEEWHKKCALIDGCSIPKPRRYLFSSSSHPQTYPRTLKGLLYKHIISTNRNTPVLHSDLFDMYGFNTFARPIHIN